MAAARSGANRPLSAASIASFFTALSRTLIEDAAKPAVSRAARQACTVALLNPVTPVAAHQR
jgi:hypothetical protein